MTFKCHKTDEQNKSQILYPVNGVGFNIRSKKYLYTVGAEGNMYFWDYEMKNKIKSFHYQGQTVCSAKMS